MLSSMPKSGLPEVVKNTPASKIGRLKLEADSPPPQKNPNFPNEISPRSADSKPVANRRSPKNSTATDKQSRPMKVSELQLQLNAVQEDLIKAKEKLAFEEKEKTRALEELGDAKKAAEEVSERLAETLLAQNNTERVDILSGEISRLQSLLDSKLENKSIETAKDVKELGSDWKTKAGPLESYLDEVKQSERSAQNSPASLSKELDEARSMLDDAESEVISLRGKVEALELEVARYKTDHENSDSQLNSTNQEVLDLEKIIEVLKFELLKAEDEKEQAMNNEKIAAQEKSKLSIELEIAREDSEKAKKAMEGLVSALHEVSSEARYIKERLLVKQAEVDSVTDDVDELRLVLQNNQENYEAMLDEAKNEILHLKKAIDKSESEAKDLRVEWNEKENDLRKTDEEVVSILLERDKAVGTLEQKKSETRAAEEEVNEIRDNLWRAESELFAANTAMEEAKAESGRLKERLLDKENELQSITQENDDLRVRDFASSEKIEELSDSLAKLSSKKEKYGHTRRGNTEYGENEKPYNSNKLSKVLEVEDKVDETETGNSETTLEEDHEVHIEAVLPEENAAENFEERSRVKMKPKNFESEIFDKLPFEMEHYAESIEEELNTEIERNKLDQVNKHQELQKKKKDLLHKFGSLLKKKNTPK